MLADRCRLPVPEKGLEKGVSQKYKTIGRILEANVAAARYYARCLREAKRAMDYLAGRGLESKVISQFGLGYAPGDGGSLVEYMKKAGFEPGIVEKAGLASRSKSGVLCDRFRDRIMFPIIDVRGRVIGFGGRMMGDDKGAKYLNTPETPVFYKGGTLYGLNRAKKHIVNGELIVVEGYMDVISLHQYGVENVVASLGTAFTQRQGEMIKRYSNNVIVAYDGDAAGQAAAQRGMEILEGMGCRVKIMQLPAGKDPDEYIKLYGREDFEKLVSGAMPLVEYRIAQLEKKYDINDMGGRVEFLKEAAAVLAKLDSELERAEYIRMVAHRAKTYETVLREEVLRLAKRYRGHSRNISGKNRHNNGGREYSYSVKAANVEAEKTLLVLMLRDRKLKDLIAGRLKREDFSEPLHRKLFELLKPAESEKEIKDADIVSAFDDRGEANRVAALMQDGLPVAEEGIDKIINDCIHTITVHKYRLRSDFLKGEIKRLSDRGTGRTKGEEEQYRMYCEEFMDIQRKLKGL